MDHRMKINYSAFIDIDVGEWNGEKCLILPIRKNDIYVEGKKIMQSFVIKENISREFNSTHYIKQVWSKKHMAWMRELGFKLPPIVGSVGSEMSQFKYDAFKKENKISNINKNKINTNIDNALNK